MRVSIKHESMIGTVITFLLFGWVPGSNALETGPIGAWMEQTFCTGQNDYVNLPWNCAGFIHCEIGHSHWMNCGVGLQFDSATRACVLSSNTCGNEEDAAATYCPSFKELKFAHPKSCAMYYDCSKTTQSQFGLKIYEEECPFPMLFDHKLTKCRNQDPENPVPCTNTPSTRCDYVKECGPAPASDGCSSLGDGKHPDPLGVFLPSYIVCTGGVQTGPFSCTPGKLFDPTTRQCIANVNDAMSYYCAQNPTALLSDPLKCSMYYNCSKLQHHSGILRDYQTECNYLYLYDLGTRSCRRFDQMTIPCGFRSEPKAPCEYRVSDCTTGGSCLPCSADCVGLPDGNNPYPGFPNTRFHLTCEGKRTLDIKQCPYPLIFLPGLRVCGTEGEDSTPPTADPTVTPSTNPPVTDPPVTDPPVTDPPVTDPPVTDPPVTDPPVTDPPVTDPPVTEPPVTDPPITDPPPAEQCTMTPVCEAELALVNDNITMLTDGIIALSNVVNEKLPDPFSCHTPTTIENGYVELFYSTTQAIANYTCVSGYDFYGESTRATCETDNMWGPIKGRCLKSEFTSVDGALTIQLGLDSTLIIKGRQIKDAFTILLKNSDGTGVTVLDFDGYKIKFGKESSGLLRTLPHTLENVHEWRLFFGEKLSVRLDGELLGVRSYLTDLYEDIILEFNEGYIPDLVRIERNSHSSVHEIEPLAVNLAYRKLAEVTSTTGDTEPAAITDGRNVIDAVSCWASTDVDNMASAKINLQQEYSISRVVVTLPNCTEASWCSEGLMGFAVLVDGYLCGSLPTLSASQVVEITCNRPLTGTSITIEGMLVPKVKLNLGLCEVEVYGGRINGRIGEWSPFECPNPPMLNDATVRLEYRENEAIAVYTCSSTHLSCAENNIIRCTGSRGWESEPRTCIPMMAIDVPSMQLCPFSVGSALEIWVKPPLKEFTHTIVNSVDKSVLVFGFDLTVPSLVINDNPAPQGAELFKLGEETRILITILTNHLIVTVDGKEIYRELSPQQEQGIYLTSLPSHLTIPKTIIHPSIDVDYKRLTTNLIDGKSASGSSYLTTLSVVLSTLVPANYATCWMSGVGDHAPWIEFDLEKQFLIESVTFVTDDCTDCTGNIQASGTTIAVGNPGNLLDLNTGFEDNTCFKSTDPNAYWMVDTKGLFGILDVTVTGHKNSLEDFSDFNVLLYAEDPTKTVGTEPESVVCATQTGPVGDVSITYRCSSPSDFRFLKIVKTPTATTPLHLCEVSINKFGNTMLKDFKVTVSGMPEETPRLCYEQRDKDTDPTSTTVHCNVPVTGRYVRLTKQTTGDLDVLKICSMSASGSEVIQKAWTPYSCPKPPLSSNSDVSVSWNDVEAVATYTCREGFYNYYGEDVMYCRDSTGWDMEAKSCERSLFTESPSVLYRALRLGEAVEVYLTPTTNRNSIYFGEELMDADMTVDEDSVKFFQAVVTITQNFDLELNKENQYIFTLLTNGVELDIDGIYIGRVPHSRPLDTINVHPTDGLRSVRVMPVSETVAHKRAVLDELSMVSALSSSADGNSNANKAIGGEATVTVATCWIAAPEEDPYIIVDLDNLYYITHVEIDTRSDCNDEPCKQRTHDVDIRVFHDLEIVGETPQFCAFHKEAITSPTATIKCEGHVTGRHVKVTGLNRKNDADQFTICEIRVFGGEIIRNPKDAPLTNLPFDPCPTSEGYISVESPRLCYKISDSGKVATQINALKACGEGRQLLDIDTQDKHDYFKNVIENMGTTVADASTNVRLYVGLNKNGEVWKWNSGSSFVVWEGVNPDGTDVCAVFLPGGISDHSCTSSLRYICEVPMSTSPTGMEAPAELK